MSGKIVDSYQIIQCAKERFGKTNVKFLLNKLYQTEEKQEILGIERSKRNLDPLLITKKVYLDNPNQITLQLFNVNNDEVSYVHLTYQTVELKVSKNLDSQLVINDINVLTNQRRGYGDILIKYTKLLAGSMNINSIVGKIPDSYMTNTAVAEKLYLFFEGNNLPIDLNNYFYLSLSEDTPKILYNESGETSSEDRFCKINLVKYIKHVKRKLQSITSLF